MVGLIAGRAVSSLMAVVGASAISFILLRLVPGNPARLILGPFASQEDIDRLVEDLGLNDPLHVQYLQYVHDFIRGDWGFAYSVGQPVSTQLRNTIPATVELALYAFLFAFIAAVVLALLTTYRRRPILDGGIKAISFFGLGTPPFWFALMLLVVFSEKLHVLPAADGRLSIGADAPPSTTGLYTVDALIAGEFSTLGDALQHLVLPAIALGLAPFAFLVRLLRANLLDVAREPFILVVRSKGVPRLSAFALHALPNAFLPTLTAGGLIFGQLLAGSVLVEKIFNWPGAGALVTEAIGHQDYAVVQAYILLSALVYVVVNLAVDVCSGLVDPRVRLARRTT